MSGRCHIPLVVVAFLGIFSLISLAGVIWLVANKAGEGSIALVSGLCGTSLGAVGTILSSTRSTGDAQNVSVVNPPNHPVPVEQSPEK